MSGEKRFHIAARGWEGGARRPHLGATYILRKNHLFGKKSDCPGKEGKPGAAGGKRCPFQHRRNHSNPWLKHIEGTFSRKGGRHVAKKKKKKGMLLRLDPGKDRSEPRGRGFCKSGASSGKKKEALASGFSKKRGFHSPRGRAGKKQRNTTNRGKGKERDDLQVLKERNRAFSHMEAVLSRCTWDWRRKKRPRKKKGKKASVGNYTYFCGISQLGGSGAQKEGGGGGSMWKRKVALKVSS